MEDTLPQQQQTFSHASGYDASMSAAIVTPQLPESVSHLQQYSQQPYPSQQPLYHPQQQQQQQQQQQLNAYSLPPPPAMPLASAPPSTEERATHLIAACESCLVVTRIPGVDMSFCRIMERKCPRCSGTLVLPQEIMEMLILYGHFVSESVVVTLLLGTMVLHPSLRPDFMAAAMNELLTPLQTDFVYDVAVPKRPEGLGMSLRMNQGSLVVGGFIDFENNSESPSVAARIIAVDDVLVAINKKSITSWSFEKSISMLAHAASPVYLTFRRRQAVMLL
uniref:PDZ domain-containing protein n=1 Tax=Peronospora matthiolae TaxID=2874970 RepID=A0AAV1TH70_9STRA